MVGSVEAIYRVSQDSRFQKGGTRGGAEKKVEGRKKRLLAGDEREVPTNNSSGRRPISRDRANLCSATYIPEGRREARRNSRRK